MGRALFPLSFVALLGVAPPGTFAQVLYQDAKDMEKMGLAKTTTFVQLLGDPVFDTRIRAVLGKGWGITREVVFVQPGDKETGYPSGPTRSYLSFGSFTLSTTNTLANGRDNLLALYWGDNWGEKVVTVSLDLFGDEKADSALAWRLPLAIRSMEQLVQHAQLTGRRVGADGMNAEELAEGKAGVLRKKTLLVPEGRFDENERPLLRANYPYPLEIVPRSEIVDAIDQRDDRYAILVFVEGMYHQVYAYDAATYDLLYADRRALDHTGFNASDMKGLTKAVEKE